MHISTMRPLLSNRSCSMSDQIKYQNDMRTNCKLQQILLNPSLELHLDQRIWKYEIVTIFKDVIYEKAKKLIVHLNGRNGFECPDEM